MAQGTALDPCARVAADPRQRHAAGDHRDRYPADGKVGTAAACGGDARAQPHLPVERAPYGAVDRIRANDGDCAWPKVERGTRRAPDLPGRAMVADRCAAFLLAAAVARW